MAEYLIQDTTLTAIGNAIRSKEGSSGTIPVSSFASRLSAIKTGATVQRKSGTFTTDSSGKATVTCGFKPDLVVLHRSDGATQIAFSCAAAFAEDSRKSQINLGLLSTGTINFYEILVSRSDTGFSIAVTGYLEDWSESTTKTTFSYIAVKYT